MSLLDDALADLAAVKAAQVALLSFDQYSHDHPAPGGLAPMAGYTRENWPPKPYDIAARQERLEIEVGRLRNPSNIGHG
jgi:hypothetical protein